MEQLSGNKYELTSSTALSSNSAIAAGKDQQYKVQNSGLHTFFFFFWGGGILIKYDLNCIMVNILSQIQSKNIPPNAHLCEVAFE